MMILLKLEGGCVLTPVCIDEKCICVAVTNWGGETVANAVCILQ